MLTFINGSYVSDDFLIKKGNVTINGENIISAGSGEVSGKTVDLNGNLLSPGFIDIHIHGAKKTDIMDGNADSINRLAVFLASTGTTSFFPTTVAADTESILDAIQRVRKASQKPQGASIDGVHIEGPFVSSRRKGVFDPSFLRRPSTSEYDLFHDAAGSLKVRITAAPELEGSARFFRHVRMRGGCVSIGHSDGLEKDAIRGLENGANCFTHLFNAMRGIHHREPGIAGAAIDSSAYTELICDGMHVVPTIVRMVFRARDPNLIALITDAMPAMGCGDGDYSFCGSSVHVKNGKVTEDDGTMAGSTLTMVNAVKNAERFADISLAQAIRCASLVPAKAAGIADRTGSITPGKRADLIVMDYGADIKEVYCRGKKIYDVQNGNNENDTDKKGV